MKLLSVQNLKVSFFTRNGIVRAVNDVSFDLHKGETLGIVGESGSGKSVTSYSLLGLLPTPPARIEGGKALFHGKDLLQMTRAELEQVRGKKISIIFQDPMTCLNPYMNIQDQLMEPLLIHEKISKLEAQKRALRALEDVGVPDAKSRIRLFPHEFSGGMRQRVMIAMALITNPEILIADEPTTALDVTVQAQILELIQKLQKNHGTAVMFITHDLGVVARICNRINVMYAGKIMETGSSEDIFYNTQHPYTKALLKSIPSHSIKSEEDLYTIPGLPPDVSKEIKGCPFAPRCSFVADVCKSELKSHIKLKNINSDHLSSCTRVNEGLKI